MNLQITRHEDDRRVLTEWISNIPIKRCKVLEIKQKCTLGNHYHFKSDSVFYILKGNCNYTLKSIKPNSKLQRGWLFEGEGIFVPREVIHTFYCYKDTIMLEAATEPFDKNDEIAI